MSVGDLHGQDVVARREPVADDLDERAAGAGTGCGCGTAHDAVQIGDQAVVLRCAQQNDVAEHGKLGAGLCVAGQWVVVVDPVLARQGGECAPHGDDLSLGHAFPYRLVAGVAPPAQRQVADRDRIEFEYIAGFALGAQGRGQLLGRFAVFLSLPFVEDNRDVLLLAQETANLVRTAGEHGPSRDTERLRGIRIPQGQGHGRLQPARQLPGPDGPVARHVSSHGKRDRMPRTAGPPEPFDFTPVGVAQNQFERQRIVEGLAGIVQDRGVDPDLVPVAALTPD